MNHTTHLRKINLLAALILFIMMACGGTNTVTPVSDEDAVASMVASTLQAYQSLATPTLAASATSIPASPVPPSPLPPTQAPTATFVRTPLPSASRIQFLTGATQTVLSGQIQPGQTIHYVVQAAKGQPLIALLDSPNQDTKLAVVGADGLVLLSASAGLSNWQGVLPTTQDYYIQIIGGTSVQNFTLNMTIVSRVQFGSGETRLVVKGSTVGGFAVSYVAYAMQGQKMDVTLNVPGDKAALTIWGFDDGMPYARAQTGIQDFSLKLPATQDYIIDVVPQAGQVVEFSMTIRIK
jgi:hypothetical protein